MRIQTALVLGGLCALGGGCGFLTSSTRTVSGQSEYSRPVDPSDSKRSVKLAEVAWDQLRQANPEVAYSPDFAGGFKKGFADYLRGSTNGDTPPVPPPCYGHAEYESVQGRKAVLDWFRGFREGTDQALASGLRPVAPAPTAGAQPTALPSHPPSRAALQARGDVLPLPEMVISKPEVAPSKQPEDKSSNDHSPL